MSTPADVTAAIAVVSADLARIQSDLASATTDLTQAASILTQVSQSLTLAASVVAQATTDLSQTTADLAAAQTQVDALPPPASQSSPPVNATPPSLSGTPVIGGVVTVTPGTWTGDPVPTLSYQIERNGVPITGATQTTYSPTSADVGSVLTVLETAQNIAGTADASSQAIGPVTAPVHSPIVQIQSAEGENFTGTLVTSIPAVLPNVAASSNCVAGFVEGSVASGTPTLTSVTDDKNNVYTIVDNAVSASGKTQAWSFYCLNVTNAPKTITAHFGGTGAKYVQIVVAELSNVVALDQHTWNYQSQLVGTTDSITTGQVATLSDNEFVYGYQIGTAGTSQSQNVGTGFTASFNPSSEFKTQATAGNVAATWTNTSVADNFLTMMMTFSNGSSSSGNSVTPFPASGLPLIGVNSHPQSATPAQTVSLMQAVGAKIARIDMINWDAVENPKGTYNFSQATPYVTALRAAGIKICLMCGYNNHLYNAAGWGAAISGTANVAGYAAYCAAVAQTFNGSDIIYELGNEPDLSQYFNPVSGSVYGTAMAAGAVAIKALYPSATVITAGISDYNGPTYWGPYIQQMITAAGADYAKIDGLAFHTYNGGDQYNQPPEDWINNPNYAEQLISYSSVAPRPFWYTEDGMTYGYAGSNTTRQAILNARAMLTSIINGAKAYIHYDLIDDGTDYTNSEDTYGLYTYTAAAQKPSGAAFASVMAVVNACTSYAVLRSPPYSSVGNTWAIQFLGAAVGTQTIAWTSKTTDTLSLGKPANQANVSIKDLFGAVVTPAYDGSGNLVLSLTNAQGPLIVTGI